MRGIWQVTFVAMWVVVTTNVEASDEEEAIANAADLIKDQYGWDVAGFDAEAEPTYDADVFA